MCTVSYFVADLVIARRPFHSSSAKAQNKQRPTRQSRKILNNKSAIIFSQRLKRSVSFMRANMRCFDTISRIKNPIICVSYKQIAFCSSLKIFLDCRVDRCLFCYLAHVLLKRSPPNDELREEITYHI
ncbi:MAG: hypothetical protein K0R48_1244 [Gammaproteobacteria bacterium]|nr:hypothetical protein [Gammaproteobacteria bacterium]